MQTSDQLAGPVTGTVPPQPRTRKSAGRALPALGNAFVIAVDTLWAHKLRSALTIFGIVIGIAAVVLVGAALEALTAVAVKTTAQAFGANTFLIAQVASVGNLSRRELSDKLRRNPEIYRREAEALAARDRDDLRMAPSLQANSDVKAGNRILLGASVVGSTANLQSIREIRVATGRFFTEEENRRAIPVVVIGQDLVDELFPVSDPLGKTVRIRGQVFTVVGVQEKQGSSFGASLDRYVWMPLTMFEKVWGNRRSVTLYVQPKDSVPYQAAQDQARMSLRTLRRIRPGSEDNFDLLTPEAGRGFLERLTGMIAVAIVPISSVALIVAGIVVMNMMLVSVTERTREIGIRKAVGARNRDVLAQILFESTLLTLLGGAAGLGISYAGTIALGNAFGDGVPIPIPFVLLALGVASAIGVTAGLYPAWLASRMTPVKALASET